MPTQNNFEEISEWPKGRLTIFDDLDSVATVHQFTSETDHADRKVRNILGTFALYFGKSYGYSPEVIEVISKKCERKLN